MTDLRFPAGDDDVTRELRDFYAAPSGNAYWNELEARVMARVGEIELGWWTELDRWLRPALAAAAILVITAGVAMFHANRTETESAYEELFTPAPIAGAPIEASAVQRNTPEPRDNALRFILSRPR